MNILPRQHWRAIVTRRTLCAASNHQRQPIWFTNFLLLPDVNIFTPLALKQKPRCSPSCCCSLGWWLAMVHHCTECTVMLDQTHHSASTWSRPRHYHSSLLLILYKLKLFHFISPDSCWDVRPPGAWMYRLYCDPVLIYAAVNQMLLLKSNPLLVAEASSTIEESPINQVQRIGNGWSRVTTNTATAAALSTPAPGRGSFAQPSRV